MGQAGDISLQPGALWGLDKDPNLLHGAPYAGPHPLPETSPPTSSHAGTGFPHVSFGGCEHLVCSPGICLHKAKTLLE